MDVDDKQAFYVESVEGRKFKMVIRGDLGKLSVGKIRRYLRSYGVREEQQLLASDGVTVLTDDMVGDMFGLVCNAVLRLRDGNDVHRNRNNATTAATTTSVVPRECSVAVGAAAAVQQQQRQQQQMHGSSSDKDDAYVHHEAAATSPTSHTAMPSSSWQQQQQQQQRACEAVRKLGVRLGVSLSLDAHSMSCALVTDADVTVMLTYDVVAARLHLHTPLLTPLPRDAAVRQKLYEVLLEGALLTREVCGGGVGVSRQHNMVVLTTSIDVRHSSDAAVALADTLPEFVTAAQRWRSLLVELVT